jgi:hypothetical protein
VPLAAVVHRVGDPLALYEVAGTVIPVLFLTAVYEARVLESLSLAYRWTGVVVASLFSFAGGLDTYTTLANRQPTLKTEHGVEATLFFLGLTLVCQPLVKVAAELDAAEDAAVREALSVEERAALRRRLSRQRIPLWRMRRRHVIAGLFVIGGSVGTVLILTV